MTRSRKHWTALQRNTVAARQGYKCAHCKQTFPAVFDIDHIVPLHKGGEDALGNLQALCCNCHAIKSRNEQSERRRQERAPTPPPTDGKLRAFEPPKTRKEAFLQFAQQFALPQRRPHSTTKIEVEYEF
tara:strand:+ start:243 stop:629 length:387 start_codon:yes stop_codon:yes gene_type:complete